MDGNRPRLERVAIVGGSGQLGSQLVRVFGAHAIALDHAAVEVEDPTTIAHALLHHRPTFVITTAAYHNVEQCERHAARAFGVNAVGTANLVTACALAGVGFAFVSTDYVFDGKLGRPYRESDPPHPLQTYGVSKLAGEHLTLHHANAYVFRTSALYGPGGTHTKGATFVERIVRQAQRDEPIRVVDDITVSPSYAPHIATQIRHILESASPGIYHTTNAGFCTWYDFAKAALRVAGYAQEIVPVAQADLHSQVRRPQFSALDHEASRRAHIPEAPPWIEGLAAYIAEAGLGVEQARRDGPDLPIERPPQPDAPGSQPRS